MCPIRKTGLDVSYDGRYEEREKDYGHSMQALNIDGEPCHIFDASRVPSSSNAADGVDDCDSGPKYAGEVASCPVRSKDISQTPIGRRDTERSSLPGIK